MFTRLIFPVLVIVSFLIVGVFSCTAVFEVQRIVGESWCNEMGWHRPACVDFKRKKDAGFYRYGIQWVRRW